MRTMRSQRKYFLLPLMFPVFEWYPSNPNPNTHVDPGTVSTVVMILHTRISKYPLPLKYPLVQCDPLDTLKGVDCTVRVLRKYLLLL
jgi:hypothetical protein